MADCDPTDRLPFLETMIEGLCQGGPLPAFGGVMASARDWATGVCCAELNTCCLASFEAMEQRAQAAFLGQPDRGAAA